SPGALPNTRQRVMVPPTFAPSFRWGFATVATLAIFSLGYPARAADAPSGQTPPAKVVELKVEPAALTLTGPRDSRRFVVRGKTADGSWIDLSAAAKAQISGDCVRLDGAFVEPIKDGQATVQISSGGLAAQLPVTVKDATAAVPVSFVRDIMPILAKS